MLHARSVLGYETVDWQETCKTDAKHNCKVGFACPDSTTYTDKLVDKNKFTDDHGNYCNCWRNQHIDKLVPNLEVALHQLKEVDYS